MTPQLVNRGGHSIRFLDGSGTLEDDALEPQLLDPSIVCFQIGCVGALNLKSSQHIPLLSSHHNLPSVSDAFADNAV